MVLVGQIMDNSPKFSKLFPHQTILLYSKLGITGDIHICIIIKLLACSIGDSAYKILISI